MPFALCDIEHMNKHKVILVFIFTLLGFVYISWSVAEVTGLVEQKDTGTIDWARGVAQARGISAPIKKSRKNTP